MKTKNILITFLLLFFWVHATSQSLLPKLQQIFGTENVVSANSSVFNEYYYINVKQPVDHTDSSKGYFHQRVFLGHNNTQSPTLLETLGYQIPTYVTIDTKLELTELLNTNQVYVEHRYFGKSVPDATNAYLTCKQASDDYHNIRQLLSEIYPNKWLSSGTSKGGYATLAYKYYYPNDVNASFAYVAPFPLEKEDKRPETFLEEKRKTEVGKRIFEYQLYLLKNKKELMPVFDKMVKAAGMNTKPLTDTEILYDYAVLEMDFTFWQNDPSIQNFERYINESYDYLVKEGFVTPIELNNFEDKMVIYLLDCVHGFTDPNYTPHYYQAFSEMGYYGYNEKPFEKYLKQKDYPLEIFAQKTVTYNSDNAKAIKIFTETTIDKMIFIYGANDPWTATSVTVPPKSDNLLLVHPTANHSVEIGDFSANEKEKIMERLNFWLK